MTDLATTIRKLRAEGKRWSDIERITGIKYDKAKRLSDPGYAQRRAQDLKTQRMISGYVKRRYAEGGSAKDEIERIQRLRATIPPDTRNITGKIFGDPLPGRSALDMETTR